MDASYKIQRGIHVHLIQFFMCPEFWVHISKVKQGFRCYCTLVMAAALLGCCSMTAFAADDPLEVVNNLSEFIFGLIRAVGLILLGWGIVQVGLSLQSHDPSQRSNGFLTLAGGIVITFAKEILTLITG